MTVLIFDLDGVLVSSKDTYARVVCEVLGVGLEDAVSARVPHVGRWVDALVPGDRQDRDGLVEELTREVRSRMKARAGELDVRESAREVLEVLSSSCYLYLLTNSTSGFAHGVLDRIGLWGIFRGVITSDDGFGDKDKAIAHIGEQAGVDGRSMIYVGDTAGDVACARRAGCRSVVVYTPWSWDHGSKEAIEAERPDALTECFSDLPAVVEELG